MREDEKPKPAPASAWRRRERANAALEKCLIGRTIVHIDWHNHDSGRSKVTTFPSFQLDDGTHVWLTVVETEADYAIEAHVTTTDGKVLPGV